MAGDWFPLQYWRSRCPEIVRVSSATGRTRHEVLGWVCDFWSWVSTESADGRLPGIRVANLTEIIGADPALWEAFRSVGWIGEDEGGIIVPGWDAWLCESGKKRLKDAQRKKNARNEGSETPPKKPSAKRPRNVRGVSAKSPPTEQDRREEEKYPPNPPPGGGEEVAALVEEIHSAIAEVTGLDPVTAAKKIRPAADSLAAASPAYTPAEVREFGQRFRQLCPWSVKQKRDRPTPKELAENIGLVRSKRAPPKSPRTFSNVDTDDILAKRKREEEAAAAARADLAGKGINLGSLFDKPPGAT